MRVWRVAATALLLLPGGVVAAAPPASATAPPASAAADQTPPSLVDLTVSPDAVTVAGLDLVPVTVSVRLIDAAGVEPSTEMDGSSTPSIGLRRAGGDRTDGAELSLTAGTPQDGTWSATIQVPSTWDGVWEVNRLIATDAAGNRLEADPSASLDAGLAVTGTHQPAVTMRLSPDPLVGDGPLTVEGRFYYKDTGEGIGNQPIFFGNDNLCVEYQSPPNGTTRADGTFTRVYPKGDAYLRCVGIPRPSNVGISPRYIVVAAAHPRVKPTVTAKANRTTVTPGTTVTFTGVVKPAGGWQAELQQLQGTKWRRMAGVTSDDRGGYTVAVAPKTPGTLRYRVVIPQQDPSLVGVSETVTVRVSTPGGQSPPGGGGGAGGGGAGNAGGGGTGGLPITGPATAPLVGGGVALLIVGAGLMLLARRRRPTPTGR
ncbi:hypothetical protein [Micromonospora chalcea]|uniref:hypothetical protein n=1 Tax=Micromonospora chalcea TaxID=1874 RepID=UPI0021A6CB0E|nr:hypothetical protein [Micromonospora chalcea]MCT2279662.1 hypothetical protein [Micromonospora chalcea]